MESPARKFSPLILPEAWAVMTLLSLIWMGDSP